MILTHKKYQNFKYSIDVTKLNKDWIENNSIYHESKT